MPSSQTGSQDNFLLDLDIQKLISQHGTPLYVYSRHYLNQRGGGLLKICQDTDTALRYAVKANSHPEIIKLFNSLGLDFDASSAYEAEHLIQCGINPAKISLSSQQPPHNLKVLLDGNVQFVASSPHQLELVSQTGWRGKLAVRLNPGVGSGHNNRTTTGGSSASFGIWHEYIPEVLAWQEKSGCTIDRLHMHIGSGADAKVWQSTIRQALELVERFTSVSRLDIGGGYKIARMPGEQDSNMAQILSGFAAELSAFEQKTGRKIKLEIEPGTWLVANAGVLLSQIVDIVDTGKQGYSFIKLDTGMNDFLRPTLYGAQHPITILNDAAQQQEYVVVGHNCESGDILTPLAGDPERIAPRRLNMAKIGDIAAIGGAGAYAASMRAIGYNSFPAAAEIIV